MAPIASPTNMMENDEVEDCQICLDPMSPADLAHPIRCPTRCGFNFCLSCIESLITSSKDDYGEASDGNMHVKVFLNCPNCRADLGPSIRDTLLCRKVHTLKIHSDDHVDLTASERRLKDVMHEKEVQLAIQEAMDRENIFFGKEKELNVVAEDKDDTQFTDSFTRNIKEMGVEADIDSGVHTSFVIRKNQPAPKDKSRIDPTLFQGLDCAMSKEEQETLTELLTSGDTNKLAGAAEILHGIAIRIHKGLPPPKPLEELSKPQRSRSSSIYQLIDESKIAQQKAVLADKKAVAGTVNRKRAVMPQEFKRIRTNERFANHKAVEKEIALKAQFMKLHPLPVRMPKFVEFNLHDKKSRSFLPFFLSSDESAYPLSFCDDVWDGSVIDAFCKISVTGGKEPIVTKKVCENVGVINILEGGGDGVEDWIDSERGRVLVASVRSEAGRQGVLKGDVVTHFNGEEFEGTAADLDAAIKAQAERSSTGTFSLVLNAEPSVAEALKRRAMI